MMPARERAQARRERYAARQALEARVCELAIRLTTPTIATALRCRGLRSDQDVVA
jgi:hypothetical protein